MENKKVNHIRKRTLKSFAVFIFFGILFFSIWFGIKAQKVEDEIPTFFRFALEFNAKIWHWAHDNARSSMAEPPVKGTPARINGDIGMEAPIDLSSWSLIVLPGNKKGVVTPAFSITMEELKRLPKSSSSAEFRCIEGWSENISYAGVKFIDFLNHYKIGSRQNHDFDEKNKEDNFSYVGLETPDGNYYVSIDMESMIHPQTILAYEMNGLPLTKENGAPLRLIIPIKYGIKNIKRIGKIFFSDRRPPDYWAQQGYDWFSGL